jgi:hypothetical protein
MRHDKSYSTWKEFELEERRRFGTFQLSLDELAKDLYIDPEYEVDEDEEPQELNFDE